MLPALGCLLIGLSQSPAIASHDIQFKSPVTIPCPHGAGEGIAVADFDGDGNADIAVVGNGYVTVLYGQGNGKFASRAAYPAGQVTTESRLIACDLDGDGLPEIVFGEVNSSSIGVLHNNAHRHFGTVTHYAVGAKPYGLAAGDLNQDGRLDVVVADDDGDDISVLLNVGKGALGKATHFAAGSYPSSVAIADVNGDGHPDVLCANYVSADVYVYLGDGKGGLSHSNTYSVGSQTAFITSNDFNRDGVPDFAVSNTFSSSVSVLTGKGDGTFTVASVPADTYPHLLGNADFKGDGYPALAVPHNSTTSVSIYPNSGDGTFGGYFNLKSGGDNVRSVAVGDFNGDGKPDLAVSNEDGYSVSVFLNNTPMEPRFLVSSANGKVYGMQQYGGRFASPISVDLNLTSSRHITGYADFNGDGQPDIVVQDSNTGEIVIYMLDKEAVTKTVTLAKQPTPEWHVVGTPDLAGSGQPGLLLQSVKTGALQFWKLSSLKVVSQTAITGVTASSTQKVVGTGSLNADIYDDLVVEDTTTGKLSVYLMSGTAVTQTSALKGALKSTQVVAAVGLVDGGLPRILLQDTTTGQVTYLVVSRLGSIHVQAVGTLVPELPQGDLLTAARP
jgi:hypothetical protein